MSQEDLSSSYLFGVDFVFVTNELILPLAEVPNKEERFSGTRSIFTRKKWLDGPRRHFSGERRITWRKLEIPIAPKWLRPQQKM